MAVSCRFRSAGLLHRRIPALSASTRAFSALNHACAERSSLNVLVMTSPLCVYLARHVPRSGRWMTEPNGFVPVRMIPVSIFGYPKRVPLRVPEMLTLAYVSVHFLFAPYALKSLEFRRFRMKKGLPDCSENPESGAKGIRTPDPLHAMEMRYQLRHSPEVCSANLI